MTIELGAAARALGVAARRDATVLASDGRSIGVRVTQAQGAEKAVLVYMNGTAVAARLFDGMADKLAEWGITSYSITSRTHLDAAGRVLPDVGFRIHSDDLARVVATALAEHPDTPAAVAGTSLGAHIAMHFNNTLNVHGLDVGAFAPVPFDKFLPITDKLKVLAAAVSGRAGRWMVPTPMAMGRKMTTNPASPFVTRAADFAKLRVPARIFRDVLEMSADTVRHRSDAGGRLRTVLGGADAVSVRPIARLFAEHAAPARLRAPIVTLPGVPHEMSQEWHDERMVNAFANLALNAPLPR